MSERSRSKRALAFLAVLALNGASARAAPDSDSDGVADSVELEEGDSDADGIPNYLDPDDDNDTRPTLVEGAENDADADETPDFLETDEDDDGLVGLAEDVNHDDVLTAADDTDGDGRINSVDADDDGDGVSTRTEIGEDGPSLPRDTDGDLAPDYLDTDDDGDGVLTADERTFGDVDQNQNGVLAYLDPLETGRTEADSDSDGVGDSADLDDDDDGVLDTLERVGDGDGDGLVDRIDPDDDGDYVPTTYEYVSASLQRDTDGDGTLNYLDPDDDGDGILTRDEAPDPNGDGIVDDARKTAGEPDYLNADDDQDGVPTRQERPGDVDRDTDGDGKPNQRDGDDDGDDRDTAFELGLDTDSDGVADYLDPDDDGDGLLTKVECGNYLVLDYDRDAVINCLDLDSDNDTILDADEGLLDRNGNGLPDYLDATSIPDDADNDGVEDKRECPTTAAACPDTDADGVPDKSDPDDDGDGVSTRDEDGQHSRDTDLDGVLDYVDVDDDGDGVLTRLELGADTRPRDTDRDGVPDYLDADDDGDGVLTRDEGGPERDSDLDTVPDYLDAVASPLDGGTSGVGKDAGGRDAGVPSEAGSGGLTVGSRSDSGGCAVSAVPGERSGLWLLFLGTAFLLRLRRIFARAPKGVLRHSRVGVLVLGLEACGGKGVPTAVLLDDDGGQRPVSDAAVAAQRDATVEASTPGCDSDELTFRGLPPSVRHGFGAAVVGNRIHLGYLTRGCATDSAAPSPRAVRYVSFGTTGPVSEARDLSSADCALLQEPTLVAHGAGNVGLFVGRVSDDSPEVDYRDLLASDGAGGVQLEQTHTPEQRELDLAAVTLVSGDVPTLAFTSAPYRSTMVAPVAIASLQPGRVTEEILPVSAGHFPLQLTIGAVAGAAAPGLAAWVSNLGTNTGVFARELDRSGRGNGPIATLSSSIGPRSAVSIATRPEGTAVVYTESRDGNSHELRFRALSASGVLGAPVTLTTSNQNVLHFAVTTFRTGFAIAYRNAGNALNPAATIRVLAVDTHGAGGAGRHIANTTASGTQVAVLAGNDGRLVALWDEDASAAATTEPASPASFDLHAARLTCL